MRKILTIVSLLLSLAASADEGMWTLFNLPQAIRERMRLYGCQLSDEALTTTLPSAVVNFSGFCTGEVVSPNGLLMTNHHCGFEATVASAAPDFMTCSTASWLTPLLTSCHARDSSWRLCSHSRT